MGDLDWIHQLDPEDETSAVEAYVGAVAAGEAISAKLCELVQRWYREDVEPNVLAVARTGVDVRPMLHQIGRMIHGLADQFDNAE